jgi:hypothetical protein
LKKQFEILADLLRRFPPTVTPPQIFFQKISKNFKKEIKTPKVKFINNFLETLQIFLKNLKKIKVFKIQNKKLEKIGKVGLFAGDLTHCVQRCGPPKCLSEKECSIG